MAYTFESLSPPDFEILTRDLLQKELNVTLEAFKTGRDQGIDLRYSRDPTATIIIQCKHWRQSGYHKLVTELKGKELEKIKALDPQRYIISTSVPLTPQNKSAIKELLSPYVKSAADIYGADDLNSLLARFPEIERKNFKLWLASTEALDRFFSRDIHVRSTALVDRVKKKLPLYVTNESFPRALEILESHHVCIISGIPGIGKTTLADVLLVRHLEQDYEAIEIGSDIGEADSIYNPASRQIFYYDDFLGTAFDGQLSKNEDTRLLRLMRRVRHTPNKKLILTTREYIFRNAAKKYERVSGVLGNVEQCIVSLEDYTQIIRAEILYNHIYFSRLSESARQTLVKDRKYWPAIEHANFSPRIIEHAVEFGVKEALQGDQFSELLLESLDNPARLWEHVFENQLPGGAQCLLLALLFLPDGVYLEDLFAAAHSLAVHRLNQKMPEPLLRQHLKILEGTFVEVTGDAHNKQIEFHTPAIPDFLLHFLDQNPFDVTTFLKANRYFEQAVALCLAAVTSEGGSPRYMGLFASLSANDDLLCQALEESFSAKTCVPWTVQIAGFTGGYRPAPSEDEKISILTGLCYEKGILSLEPLVTQLVSSALHRWNNQEGERDYVARIVKYVDVPNITLSKLKAWALNWHDEAIDFDLAISLQRYEDPDYRIQVKKQVSDFLEREVDFVIYDCDDADIAQEVKDDLETLASEFDISLGWERGRMEERISELNVRADYPEKFDYDRVRDQHIKDNKVGERAAVDNLFATLVAE